MLKKFKVGLKHPLFPLLDVEGEELLLCTSRETRIPSTMGHDDDDDDDDDVDNANLGADVAASSFIKESPARKTSGATLRRVMRGMLLKA